MCTSVLLACSALHAYLVPAEIRRRSWIPKNWSSSELPYEFWAHKPDPPEEQ